jgi:hypothetical protein
MLPVQTVNISERSAQVVVFALQLSYSILQLANSCSALLKGGSGLVRALKKSCARVPK